MERIRTLAPLALAMILVLAACSAGTGAPNPPPPSAGPTPADPLVEVRAALVASGIAVVDALDTTASDPTYSCLSASMHTFAFDEEAPHASLLPGDKPPINALAFASTADRQAAQRQISSDGTQISGPSCGAMIEWVAPPHWAGGGRYLLLVVSADSGLASRVAAAATRLGSP